MECVYAFQDNMFVGTILNPSFQKVQEFDILVEIEPFRKVIKFLQICKSSSHHFEDYQIHLLNAESKCSKS